MGHAQHNKEYRAESNVTALFDLLGFCGSLIGSSNLLDIAKCQKGPCEPVIAQLQIVLNDRQFAGISQPVRDAITAYIFGSDRREANTLLFCVVMLIEDAIRNPNLPSSKLVGSVLPLLLTAAFQLPTHIVSCVVVWLRTVVDSNQIQDSSTSGLRTLLGLAVFSCQTWLLEQDAEQFTSVHVKERAATAIFEEDHHVDPRDRAGTVFDLDPNLSTRKEWLQVLSDTASRLDRAKKVAVDVKTGKYRK